MEEPCAHGATCSRESSVPAYWGPAKLQRVTACDAFAHGHPSLAVASRLRLGSMLILHCKVDLFV